MKENKRDGFDAESRQREVDFREVCEHLYDGIHIADSEGRVIFVNEAYLRTTGFRKEELLGRRVEDIEAEGKLYSGAVTMRVLREKKRINSVARVLPLNKEVLVTGTPVFDQEGNIRLVVTNTRDFPELKQLEKELQSLKQEKEKAAEELSYLRKKQTGEKELVYCSAAMASVMELVREVARTEATVLITGESGTGKELIASELYQRSPRRTGPFIKVNCAAIPPALLESELFGYEPGAFTGASRTGKTGLFELANTGVILLDEIGDMPVDLQVKLLRVLQQHELARIGGSKVIRLDLRVIASTNKNLLEEVRAGRFRADLYYRLSVVPIHLEPLRERREDIPLLADYFCSGFCRKYDKELKIDSGGLQLLQEYSWPGNIRELENLVERIVVTTNSGSTITREHVFAALSPGALHLQGVTQASRTLKEQVSTFEKNLILHALEKEGSIRKAAKALQVDHSTLVKKCQRYHITSGAGREF